MKSIYAICLLAVLFALGACKQESADQTQTEPTPAVPGSGQVSATQQDTRPVTEGHDYNFLTDKVLYFNTVVGADESEKAPKKGDWIHLFADGTFEAGRMKDKTHTGKWSYEHNSQTLFLRPDTQDHKMSEWKVMATDQVIVWVGTSTYGDNAIQIQLLKRDQAPG